MLLDYWSSDWGERKSQSYGKLCSQQQESLKYYKDEIKNNKRFNNLMQKLSGKVDIFDQSCDKIVYKKMFQNCHLQQKRTTSPKDLTFPAAYRL